jgi:hypothetical protein
MEINAKVSKNLSFLFFTLVKIKTSTLTHVTQKQHLNRLETNEEKQTLQANNSTKEEMWFFSLSF